MNIRPLLRPLLVLALSGPSVARAIDCEKDAGNMAQVRDCVARENDRAVKDAYDKLDARLKAKNPEASALLAQSQQDWIRFATSSCAFYARLHTDGPMMNDFRSQCWSSFSAARVRVLQSRERDQQSAD